MAKIGKKEGEKEEEKEEEYRNACMEIAAEVLNLSPRTKNDIAKIKKRVCRNYSLNGIPGDADILYYLEMGVWKFKKDNEKKDNENEIDRLRKLLRLKPVRTISGVAVVSVMTSPSLCPHGKCVPCPGGIEKGTPQSYIGLEPAAQRGRQHNYDSFDQVISRLSELKSIGHEVDKVEIIVMGGTFPAREREYKRNFILGMYNALNSFGRKKKWSHSIGVAKKRNESSYARCTGVTFETRPDFSKEVHIREILEFGGTKVELGVQTVFNDILRAINRGHNINDTIHATRLLKDSAMKVGYHIMPGLPGSNLDRDRDMFSEIFSNEDFRPDYLKIYPTLVIEGTELHKMWEKGNYALYTMAEIIKLLADVKSNFPEWVRVQRIQRDIPVNRALGLEKGNLRQLVHKRMKKEGKSCRCIRCREIGHKELKDRGDSKIKAKEGIDEAELGVIKYNASGGKEFFISFENRKIDALIGFIRLRFPKSPFIGVLEDTALIRELHVYGQAVPIGLRDENAYQHRGYGEKLLVKAEEIAKEKFDKIAIISGVGVREYYRKFGYRKSSYFMVKRI